MLTNGDGWLFVTNALGANKCFPMFYTHGTMCSVGKDTVSQGRLEPQINQNWCHHHTYNVLVVTSPQRR